ncbi:MAG: prolyl oligopeptidase family serine peptidase [Phycisphaera sp.]|nr:prolyl oligopeptidase family serine peptidase [Phycisphaera sp.]
MKRLILVILVWSIPTVAEAQWQYPPTKTVDAADTYFGKTYADPYRWLENLKAKDVEAWFRAQATLTDGVLARIPGCERLANEWLELDKRKQAAYGDIVFESGRVFYKKFLGSENVGKLYYRQGETGAEKLLFDPRTYTKEGNSVIESFVPSWDGRHVVIGLSAGGAEYSELRVLDVDTATLLPDSIYPSYGATGWLPDNASFFYDAGKVTDIRSMDIELNRKSRIHKLGDKVSGDVDLFSNESCPQLNITPEEMPGAYIDESCPEYVFGDVETVQAESRLFYAPSSEIRTGKVHWQPVFNLSDNIVRGYVVKGPYIYAVTHTGAPHYKVVRTRLDRPDWEHAETVFPEVADTVEYITSSKDYLFVVYSNGIDGRITKYEFATGKISAVPLPASGTVGISCPDWKSDLCHVVVETWTTPGVRYDYDPGSDRFKVSTFYSEASYPGFEDLVVEEVQAPSHDGVMVPLSIIHRKDIKLDGSNCCILEGYGAYGDSYTPYFDVMTSVALRGVVLAYAHVRGGSEKGEAWYKAGFKTTKPNTWKDFIACGQYLVDKGYTSPGKLAGTGTSAGGILISRAITERPDLFRAAVCNVGCANTMRMEFSPNGPVNVPEFGTVEDPVECRALYEMDGVAHVKKGVAYPAVLGVTGWNDPRVAPWEPGKFVAALQNATASDRPVLLKVNYDNGHFTEEKSVTFHNFAAQTTFLLWQTGHKDFQPTE